MGWALRSGNNAVTSSLYTLKSQDHPFILVRIIFCFSIMASLTSFVLVCNSSNRESSSHNHLCDWIQLVSDTACKPINIMPAVFPSEHIAHCRSPRTNNPRTFLCFRLGLFLGQLPDQVYTSAGSSCTSGALVGDFRGPSWSLFRGLKSLQLEGLFRMHTSLRTRYTMFCSVSGCVLNLVGSYFCLPLVSPAFFSPVRYYFGIL